MPVNVKIVFSIVVLLAAIAGYFFLDALGNGIQRYVALFIGVFAVLAFWIFPEVGKKDKAKPPR
jgi:uncharacterized RDD family membrane protein YckC